MSDELHTKTPWRIEYNDGQLGNGLDYTVYGPNGEFLIDDMPYYPTAPEPADAEFIVRAVNAHDQLVAALQPFSELLDIFEQSAGNRPKSGEICVWEDHRVGERKLTVEMLKAARAALSLATQDKETVL